MRKVKLVCEIEVPYNGYSSKSKNAKVDNYITRWVKETLKNECMFIPFYVERDEYGAFVEGCSKKTIIKVKKTK